ncbi:hypothetical protein A2U01_0000724 [Trifolium medium]|uniref:Uncharacterized protein n=1 Tax=Trifolium medium TaxID=97028 RepID=A0A392LYB4_9FABA|nr:hypothetical protein [Trifolium medium]
MEAVSISFFQFDNERCSKGLLTCCSVQAMIDLTSSSLDDGMLDLTKSFCLLLLAAGSCWFLDRFNADDWSIHQNVDF